MPGLVYDPRMLLHRSLLREDDDHPECPERLNCIYNALDDAGHLKLFQRIEARMATSEEVQFFHGGAYHRTVESSKGTTLY